MIILNDGDEIPVDALFVSVVDGVKRILEIGDPEYEDVLFKRAFEKKHVGLHESYELELETGFLSNLSGEDAYYNISDEDRVSLIGAVIVGIDIDLKVKIKIDGKDKKVKIKEKDVLQLLTDEMNFKLNNKNKRDDLLAAIELATTAQEIEAIAW